MFFHRLVVRNDVGNPACLIGKSQYAGERNNSDYRQQPVSVIRRGDWNLLMYLEECSLDGGFEKRYVNNALELNYLKTGFPGTYLFPIDQNYDYPSFHYLC